MTISSRTPEGLPNVCHMCGNPVTIEPSPVSNDATCPHCGCLLWFLPSSDAVEKVVVPVYSEMQSAAYTQPSALPDRYEIPPHVLECIPESVVRENLVIPLAEKSDRLMVAFSDPLDCEKFDKLRFILNRKISVVHAEQAWIKRKIAECFG